MIGRVTGGRQRCSRSMKLSLLNSASLRGRVDTSETNDKHCGTRDKRSIRLRRVGGRQT